MAQPKWFANDPSSEQQINHFPDITDQEGKGTCYAHATAHAIREAENRILGRNPPSHKSLVDEITDKYGNDGACTYQVLQEQCNKRQLQVEKVSKDEAKKALDAGRVIVGRFWLNEGQWKGFSKFFENNTKYVYEETDVRPGYSGNGDGGHAVAIIGKGKGKKDGKDIEYWEIKNSWGPQWGDEGKFRLSCGFPMDLYDVYFIQSQLTQQDWRNFHRITSQKDASCIVL